MAKTDRLDALTVRESDGKSYWTRIGAAFPAKDGEGWNVVLDALPINGKIMLRTPKPREERGRPGQASGTSRRGPSGGHGGGGDNGPHGAPPKDDGFYDDDEGLPF